MKLNYRDRILLTVVIVVLVWVAGVMLFIKPALEDIDTANTAREEAKATLSDLEAQVDADKDLDERIRTTYAEANKMAMKFYDYQQAQVATQNVDTLLDNDSLKNTNMSISAYTSVVLDPYKYSLEAIQTDMDILVDTYDQAGEKSADDAENADGTAENAAEGSADAAVTTPTTIGSYSIDFEFEGNIENVKNFCENLKGNPQKTLVLQSIDISYYDNENEETKGQNVKAGESDFVKGKMTLNMYVVKKLADPTVE